MGIRGMERERDGDARGEEVEKSERKKKKEKKNM